MSTLIVNLAGLLLMAAIVWWFWLYRPAQAALPSAGAIQIILESGVYSPDRIEVPANQPTTLRFLRKDPSACAATVIFDELDVSVELPLGEPKEIVITPAVPGNYRFSCAVQMSSGEMYRGEMKVQ